MDKLTCDALLLVLKLTNNIIWFSKARKSLNENELLSPHEVLVLKAGI